MSFVFSVYARAILSTSIEADDTVIDIPADYADRFATPTGSEVQRCIIRDGSDNFELVDIETNPLDGTLTVTRGVESTTAQEWEAGSIIEQYFSPGVMATISLTAALSAIGALTPAANKIPRYTGATTAELLTYTDYARDMNAVANEAAFKAYVNLEAGVDVQAYSALLSTYVSAGGLTSAELTQLAKIDAAVISATQWGYLGAATATGAAVLAAASAAAGATALGLGTGDSPTHTSLTLSNDLTVADDVFISGTTFFISATGTANADRGFYFRHNGSDVGHVYYNNDGEIVVASATFVAKPSMIASVSGALTRTAHANRCLSVIGNVTIASGEFEAGDFLLLVGDGSARAITPSSGTQKVAGSATTGAVTLAIQGIAVIIFDSATTWRVGGNIS